MEQKLSEQDGDLKAVRASVKRLEKKMSTLDNEKRLLVKMVEEMMKK